MNTTTATVNPPMYIPRTGSLADRVLAYFRQQPFEELTGADVAAKFEVPRNSVTASLSSAVENGTLVYAHNDDLTYVYTLGVNEGARPSGKAKAQRPAQGPAPAPAPVPPPPPPAPAPAGQGPNSRHKTVVRVTEAAMAALKVEVGVPINTGKGTAGMSKWQPLFDKLTAPNTSLAFPIDWKSAVAADATKRNQAAKKTQGLPTYRVAIVSETQARIWRTA